MSQSQSDYSPEKPSKSIKKSDKKSKSQPKDSKQLKVNEAEPSKGKKGKAAKGQRKEKQEKPAKKKKQANQEVSQQIKNQVLAYMTKQNRPYNALNVFDNLHGKIKKAVLENILNDLTDEFKLTCKEFGKNKVYFLNQDNLQVSKDKVDSLALEEKELKEKERELSNIYKQNLDELKKLQSKKTISELIQQVDKTRQNVTQLVVKKEKLTNIDAQKVDEKEVEKIQKAETTLRKQLNKRRKLTKQCLKTWSQILEKKIPEVAQLMGVQL